MYPYDQETIVALATPRGTGALAVVRLSGADLKQLYKSFTQKTPKHRLATFCPLYHPVKNTLLDEVIITFFEGPNSFTGEDVIEISCHGGKFIQDNIIQSALDSGARLAGPGEFSFRSYMNGKMDLLQAEAVSALISSKSTLSAEISLSHLEGKVSAIIQNIKQEVLNILTILENELNFSEVEIDLTSLDQIKIDLSRVQSEIKSILNSTVFGRNIFSGLRVVLLGRPNTGKSSLFNAILGYERAIISSKPGTTRDTVEVWFDLEGIPICLIDTAGVWESADYLDSLGVKKTMSELDRADILIVVDDNDPSAVIQSCIPKKQGQYIILVHSKCDQNKGGPVQAKSIISTSSKTSRGIHKLLTCISTYAQQQMEGFDVSTHPVLVSKRQRDLLEQSLTVLESALDQVESGFPTDIIASTLWGFVSSIKEVVGEIPNKEVIKNIFENFCVGK